MSELPKGWAIDKLESFVEIHDSKRKPINNKERQARIVGKSEDELYPYFGATGQAGVIDDYLFDGDYVALGEDGVPFFDDSKHKAYLLNGKSWVNNHAHVICGKQGVDNRFLCYFLNQTDYHGYVNGATRLKLTQANMRKMPLKVAPLNEQIRIANKLDSILAKVDKAQARLDKIPAILKRFRQSVLAAATSGELTKEWREDSVLVNITEDYIAPESWEMSTISELSMLVTSGSRGWAKYYSQEGSLFVRAQNINSDKLNLEDIAYVALPEKIEGRRTNIEKDDLLITITGANVTKAAKVHTELEDAYVSQHVCLVKLREKSSANFIELFLHDKSSGRGQLAEVAYGGGKPGLNLANIRDLKIALPPIEEQTEIARQVDRLLNKASKVEKQYLDAKARLDRLTQSILAKAFRGELVPQDPTDEAADKLLERILAERELEKPRKKTTKKRVTKAKTVEKG